MRGDINELVEDVVATCNNNRSSMLQVRGNVGVEEPGLDLIGDKEEKNIGDGGSFGKVVLDGEGCLSGGLGV